MSLRERGGWRVANLVILLAAGCGPENGESPIEASRGDGWAIIGPKGGELTRVTGGEHVTVRVAPGALRADTRITATRADVQGPAGCPVWDLGPPGTRFAESVIVELSCDAGRVRSVLPGLAVAVSENARGPFEQLAIADVGNGRVTAGATPHFSFFTLVPAAGDERWDILDASGTSFTAGPVTLTSRDPVSLLSMSVSAWRVELLLGQSALLETELTITGLVPSAALHVYVGGHRDDTALVVDATGAARFVQRLDGERRAVMLQIPSGTFFLDSTQPGGGACEGAGIGTWDAAAATCRRDPSAPPLVDTVDIGPGVTLDCAGTTLDATSLFDAVLLSGPGARLDRCVVLIGFRGITVFPAASGTLIERSDVRAVGAFPSSAISYLGVAGGGLVRDSDVLSPVGVDLTQSIGVRVTASRFAAAQAVSMRGALSAALQVDDNDIATTSSAGLSSFGVVALGPNSLIEGNRLVGVPLAGGIEAVGDVRILGNDVRAYGLGVFIDGLASTITANVITGNLTGLTIGPSAGSARVFLNDIFANTVVQVSAGVAIELSDEGRGNFWAHTCTDGPPFFDPLLDSDNPLAVDSHAFGVPVAGLAADEVPPPPGCPVGPVDADGDGHFSVATGGDDCDDFDAASARGMDELCDGADNDCDGTVDEGVCEEPHFTPQPPDAESPAARRDLFGPTEMRSGTSVDFVVPGQAVDPFLYLSTAPEGRLGKLDLRLNGEDALGRLAHRPSVNSQAVFLPLPPGDVRLQVLSADGPMLAQGVDRAFTCDWLRGQFVRQAGAVQTINATFPERATADALMLMVHKDLTNPGGTFALTASGSAALLPNGALNGTLAGWYAPAVAGPGQTAAIILGGQAGSEFIVNLESLDRTPPTGGIEVNTGLVTCERSLLVTGLADADTVRVRVNEVDAVLTTVTSGVSYSAVVELQDGANPLRVCANDLCANEACASVLVQRGRPERCDGVDDDCDGEIDQTFDDDGDSFTQCGDATNTRRDGRAGGGDCDDQNRDAYPGAPEILDSVDTDCDGLPSPPLTPEPQVDTSTVSVGRLEDTFSVSPTGAAVYALPIDLPGGRLGVKPQLALGYNSRGGNGLLGVGWHLQGTSEIRRCGKTVAQDGITDKARLTADDSLCLDGVRLVRMATICPDGGEPMRPETDVATRVCAYDIDADGPLYLRAWAPGGRIRTYGESPTGIGPSRSVLEVDGTRVAWGLSRDEDRFGNTVEFLYGGSTFEEYRLELVLYTGPIFAGLRQVRFDYEERPDIVSGHFLGHLVETTERLWQIDVLAPDFSRVWRYDLSYTTSAATGRSLLTEVQKCSADGACLRVDYGYTAAPAGYEASPVPYGLPAGNSTTTEVHGDGALDILVRPANRVCNTSADCGAGRACRSFVSQGSTRRRCEELTSVNSGLVSQNLGLELWGTPLPIDVNGDGLKDLLLRTSFAPLTGSWPDESGTCGAAGGVGLALAVHGRQPFLVMNSGLPNLATGRMWSGDFDGDGFDDLVRVRQLTTACHGRTGYEFYAAFNDGAWLGDEQSTGIAAPTTSVPGFAASTRAWVFDIDADGADELLYMAIEQGLATFFVLDWNAANAGWETRDPGFPPDSATVVGFNPSSGGDPNDPEWWVSLVDELQEPLDASLIPADANSDGLLDLYALVMGTPRELRLWLNTGEGFIDSGDGRVFTPQQLDYWSLERRILAEAIVLDIDGDGRQELLYPIGGPVPVVRALRWSREAGFATTDLNTVVWSGDYANLDLAAALTSPGGLPQILVYNANTGGWRTHTASGSPPDLLATMHDGLSGDPSTATPNVELSYMASIELPRPELSEPRYGASVPFGTEGQHATRHTMPQMQVVRDVSVLTPLTSATRQFHYSYAQPFRDTGGRGFIGFGRTEVRDSAQQRLVTTTYRNDERVLLREGFADEWSVYPFAGQVERRDTVTEVEPGYFQTVIETAAHAFRPVNGSAIRAFVETSSRDLYESEDGADPGPALSTVTVTRTVDPVLAFPTYEDVRIGGGDVRTNLQRLLGSDFATTFDEAWLDELWSEQSERRIETTTTYQNDLSAWLVGLPLTITRADSFCGNAEDGFAAPSPVLSCADERQMRQSTTITRTLEGAPDTVAIDGGINAEDLAIDFDYDTQGNVTKVALTGIADSAGTTQTRTVSATYVGEGVGPRTIVDPYGRLTLLTYDDRTGLLVSVRDPDLLITDTMYDGFGRIVATVGPDNMAARYELLAPQELGEAYRYRTVKDGAYDVTTAFGRLEQPLHVWRASLGSLTSRQDFDYNLLGLLHLISIPVLGSSPASEAVIRDYDRLGRLTQEVGRDGTVEHYYRGWVERRTDERGFATWSLRRPFGGPVAVRDAGQGVTRYGYQAQDRLRTVIDPEGNIIESLADTFGRTVTLRDANLGDRQALYNAFGELTYTVDSLGRQTDTFYDLLGRMVAREDDEGRSEWRWDGNPDDVASDAAYGQLSYALGPDGHATTYRFDHLGRSRRVERLVLDAAGMPRVSEFDFGYDANGRLGTLWYPDEPGPNLVRYGVRYAYDSSGLTSSIRLFDCAECPPLWTLAAVNAEDNPTREQFSGERLETERTYHPRHGRLDTLRTFDSSGDLFWRRYVYEAGLLRNVVVAPGVFPDVFGYDSLGRLDSVSPTFGPEVDLVYSAAGNIESKSDVGLYAYTGPQPAAATVAGGASITYDNQGNRRLDSTTLHTLHWTVFDKVREVRDFTGALLAEYEYDAERGRTVKRTPETKTEYHGDLYQRYESGGGVEHRFFVFSPYGLVATEVRGVNGASSATYYVHLDRQGSPVMITSPGPDGLTPVKVGAREYDAFGKLTTSEVDYVPSVNFGYTGHEDELELGFVNMGGRLYDPTLAQMLQPDPFVVDAYSSQSLNRYAYAFNNPLKYVDPTGFQSCAGDPYCTDVVAPRGGGGPVFQYGPAIYQVWRMDIAVTDVETTRPNDRWAQEPGPGAGSAEAFVPAPVEPPPSIVMALVRAVAPVALPVAAFLGVFLYGDTGSEQSGIPRSGPPGGGSGGEPGAEDEGEASLSVPDKAAEPQADGAGSLKGPGLAPGETIFDSEVEYDTPEAAIGQLEGRARLIQQDPITNPALLEKGYVTRGYYVDANGDVWSVDIRPGADGPKYRSGHPSGGDPWDR